MGADIVLGNRYAHTTSRKPSLERSGVSAPVNELQVDEKISNHVSEVGLGGTKAWKFPIGAHALIYKTSL